MVIVGFISYYLSTAAVLYSKLESWNKKLLSGIHPEIKYSLQSKGKTLTANVYDDIQ